MRNRETGHLDIKREVNFRMTALTDRCWDEHGSKRKSSDRESSVLNVIRDEMENMFVREVDGARWTAGIRVSPIGVGFLQDGSAALQRHAPHDGEGRDDLLQGY